MKTKTPRKTTKKAAAVKPTTKHLNVNIAYVEQIADESIATIMALRSLVRTLAEQLEDRK